MGPDQNLRTVERLVGITLIFMGFIGILLSLTGNYPLDQFTAITFLTGVALFVHGSGQTWHKWVIIGMVFALGAVFLIRGEVGAIPRFAFFWGTVLVILYYTFFSKDSKPHEDTASKGTGTGD